MDTRHLVRYSSSQALRFIFEPAFFFFRISFNLKWLSGNGLEVGPGENPFSISRTTIYLDKLIDNYSQIFPAADRSQYIDGVVEHLPFDDNKFDFVMSSHVLEHCCDTIKVLKEISRVLRPNGLIVLILPHMNRTFDKGRVISTLQKHVKDYCLKVNPLDYIQPKQRHFYIFSEFLRVSVTPFCHGWKKSALDEEGNYDPYWMVNNAVIHYHCWDTAEMIRILKHMNLKVVSEADKVPGRPDSFYIVAKKINKLCMDS